LKVNQLSINKLKREKELSESDALQKERNAERKIRFSEMSEEDEKRFSFYKMTLGNLEEKVELKPYSKEDESGNYMRRAKDETEDLDQTPKWPTGIDPVKRESIAVLTDLVKLTENARLAGILKNTAEAR
jgi:carboxyl-terminal processing protease